MRGKFSLETFPPLIEYDFGNRILKGSRYKGKYWARQENDILIKTEEQIDQFLEEIKTMHENVGKENKAINYVDLTLIVKNDGMDYKIYMKPIHKDTIIPKDSSHHPKYRMIVTENYCHRALTILKDEEGRTKDIRVLGQTARAKKYQPEEVDVGKKE